ncbi:MAG: hypothetical protein K0S27_976 [Gammaproteobacteria bacterium]|nr:hypothetical protein [Gammaproteobacteria bacterium]
MSSDRKTTNIPPKERWFSRLIKKKDKGATADAEALIPESLEADATEASLPEPPPLAAAEASSQEPLKKEKTRGWRELITEAIDLANSTALEVQLRKNKKIWAPVVDSLEKIVSDAKKKHAELLETPSAKDDAAMDVEEEKKEEDQEITPITELMAVASRMVENAKKMQTSSADYDLYYAETEEEAYSLGISTKSKHAVIVFNSNQEGHPLKAMVINADAQEKHIFAFEEPMPPNISPEEKEKKERKVDRLLSSLLFSLPGAEKDKKTNRFTFPDDQRDKKTGEIILTRENIKIVDEITHKIRGKKKKAKDIKKLVDIGLRLARDMPILLEIAGRLPYANTASKHLAHLKKDTEEGFSLISNFIKLLLPVDIYQSLGEEITLFYSPEKFKLLTFDQKAAALALMQVYNDAMKFAILSLDQLEIDMKLPPGSLANKIAVIDFRDKEGNRISKTISQLCLEFNELYEASLKTAGYNEVPTEIYPFEKSLREQREARARGARIKNSPLNGDVAEFILFTKKILGENYKRFSELKKKLAKPLHFQPKAKQLSIETIESHFLEIKKELEKSLDEKAYSDYFTKETALNENVHWMQHIGQSFFQIEQLINKIKLLQSPPADEKSAGTPLSHLAKRALEVDEIAQAFEKLMLELHAMSNNPGLKQLISSKHQQAKYLIFKLSEMSKPLSVRPEENRDEKGDVSSPKELPPEILERLMKSSNSLKDAMQSIKKHLAHSKKIFHHDEVIIEKIDGTLDKITKLVGYWEKLHAKMAQEGEKPNVLTFLLQNFSEINDVLRELPEFITLLNTLSQDSALEIASKINLMMKKMVLECDKLEIQLCLKEGFLTNRLTPLLSQYHEEIQKLGYDFKEEDRYPYAAAILAQRASPECANPLIKPRNKVNYYHGQNYDVQNAPDAAIQDAISAHIHWLILEKLAGNDIENINKKIKFLEELRGQKGEPPSVLQDRLNLLRKKNINDIHLLYEGRTVNLLKEIEYQAASPEDIVHAIDLELASLKNERGRMRFIFKKESAKLLEERIEACKKLQELLKIHTVESALNALSKNHLHYLKALKAHDADFLEKIKIMEKSIPIHLRNKIIIGAEIESEPEIKHTPEELLITAEKQAAMHHITSRIIELNSEKHTDINRKKSTLLGELMFHLSSSTSLDEALNKVKNNNTETYLLFEGRTGRAIREAENAMMTTPQLINRLQSEINALKQQQFAHLYIFSKKRKANLEKRIQALENWKNIIQKSKREETLHQAYEKLDAGDQKILKHHEAHLLSNMKLSSPSLLRRP